MRTPVTLFAALLVAIPVHAQLPGAPMRDPMKNAFPARTLCLGRFLVDIPKDAKIISNSAEYRWDKVSITRRISHAEFLRVINEKEKTLKETPHEKEPSLLKHISRDGNGTAVVMVFWESPKTRYQYETEGYKWTRGIKYFLKGSADDDRAFSKAEKVSHSLSLLRYRRDDEIPDEAGFCVDEGFFAGAPEGAHYEQADLFFRLNRHPDVAVSMSTRMVMKEGEEGLLARVDRTPTPDFLKPLAAQIRTLRRGAHAVGGIEGEELLEALPSGETFFRHSFTWESSGRPRQLYAPAIHVQMDTGKPTLDGASPPSVTDQQAVALFDAIVGSIRPRPVSAPPAPPQPEAPRLPLGTTAPSHQRCEQAGMWECAVTPTLGAKRYYFPDGWTFPQIAVRGPERTLWQKIRGYPTDRLADTTWTLVSYDVPTPRDDDGA